MNLMSTILIFCSLQSAKTSDGFIDFASRWGPLGAESQHVGYGTWNLIITKRRCVSKATTLSVIFLAQTQRGHLGRVTHALARIPTSDLIEHHERRRPTERFERPYRLLSDRFLGVE